MKFFALSALVASTTAVSLEGWPTGTRTGRDPLPHIYGVNGGAVTWGCCAWTPTELHSASGACGKSLSYSTNLCKLDCTTYTTADVCTAAQDTDRL